MTRIETVSTQPWSVALNATLVWGGGPVRLSPTIELLAGKPDRSVPVGRCRAVVQDDVLHEEVLRTIAGRHAVERPVRLVPVPGDELIDAAFVVANMLVGQLGIF